MAIRAYADIWALKRIQFWVVTLVAFETPIEHVYRVTGCPPAHLPFRRHLTLRRRSADLGHLADPPNGFGGLPRRSCEEEAREGRHDGDERHCNPRPPHGDPT